MPTSKWFLSLAVAGAIVLAGCSSDAGNAGDEAPADADAPADVADTQEPEPADEGPPQVDASMLPAGVTQEMIDAGAQVFANAGFCFTCHGQDATGSQLAPDLTDDEWLHAADGGYEEIVRVITEGVPTPAQFPAGMAPMGGQSLTDDQVREMAAYVWALSH
ncbi:MAG: c-type cytochrome [Gemmatimonadota bacterium]